MRKDIFISYQLSVISERSIKDKKMSRQDTITAQQAQTLPGLFRERVKRTPQLIAYRYGLKNNVWESLTWADMSAHVARWQAALAL